MRCSRIVFASLALWLAAPFAFAEEPEIYRQYLALQDGLPQTKDGLSAAERDELFRSVSSNRVLNVDELGHYDPKGYIGFCFGRAMGAQLLARKMSVKKESIAKLFIVGDLRSGADPEWRFHVTTLVKGEDGRWYAIDPILGRPMPAEEWIATVKRVWDKKNEAKLYLAPSDTVMPDVTRDPNGKTGKYLIELGFEPSGKRGFKEEKLGDHDVWKVSDKASQSYLLSARAPEETRFHFDGIQIGAQAVDYAGYFKDFLGDLSAPKVAAAALPLSVPCPKALRKVARPRDLRSPRFDPFFANR